MVKCIDLEIIRGETPDEVTYNVRYHGVDVDGVPFTDSDEDVDAVDLTDTVKGKLHNMASTWGVYDDTEES